MQPLAGSLLVGMGEIVGHVRRNFRILFVDSRFLGRVFKSILFLGEGNCFKKLVRNGFLSHSPTYLVQIFSGSFAPNAPFRPFLPEEIKRRLIIINLRY